MTDFKYAYFSDSFVLRCFMSKLVALVQNGILTDVHCVTNNNVLRKISVVTDPLSMSNDVRFKLHGIKCKIDYNIIRMLPCIVLYRRVCYLSLFLLM